MKRIVWVVLLLCGHTLEAMQISQSTFSAEGGSASVNSGYSNGYPWRVIESPEWVQVSSTGGGNVNASNPDFGIVVLPNNTTEDRTGVIKVEIYEEDKSYWGYTVTKTKYVDEGRIVQAGADSVVELSKEEFFLAR